LGYHGSIMMQKIVEKLMWTDEDIEVDQGSTQLIRGPMTRARTKKIEESMQQVVATILEATPKEKDLEAKTIQNVLII